jgi:hypothetical protein
MIEQEKPLYLYTVKDIEALRDILNQQAQELEIAREVIQDLVDEEYCSYDHHGYCQTHAWFSTDIECPHKRGRKFLEKLQKAGE